MFSQFRKDQYTFDEKTGENDIEQIMAACPTEKEIVWIGSNEAQPFGTDKRFDGYGYFNQYPEELLNFLNKYMN